MEFYVGNVLLQTFFVPQGAGNAWAVFEWDGQTVHVVNQLYAIIGVPQPTLESPSMLRTESFEAEMRRRIQSQPAKKPY